jgi:hypothetical protein
MKRFLRLLLVTLLLVSFPAGLRADELTDWNQYLLEAAIATNTGAIIMSRHAAIVQAAVFDAVNGIERRYSPIRVDVPAPNGASRRAAAVQAAYATLVELFPTLKSLLDERRAASLGAISSEAASEHSESIHRGIRWGQIVADEILLWRSTDGFTPPPPPFLGNTAPGQWRPTPPAFAPGAGVAFATMVPWVITSASQFRPVGPPALTSNRYASDYIEVQTMGRSTSASRTADQTLYSQFWNSASPTYFWNRTALSLAEQRHLPFSEKSRLLAVVNIAIADATIACWDAKYFYNFWRPVTAIPLGHTDGNDATTAETNWTPLVVTPAFPEYPSGHSCSGGAAARILANYFGETTSFFVTSNSPTMSGVIRSFPNFTAAMNEIQNARIFGGIHYRFGTQEGQALGTHIADYILGHAFGSIRGAKY